MKRILFLSCFCILQTLMAQDITLPYKEIPEVPSNYMAGNILARSIDGLGYRFYWASKDLRKIDLAYKPSPDGRSSLETLQHLYSLSEMILATPERKVNVRPIPGLTTLSYEALRAKTLINLKKAADIYRDLIARDIAQLDIRFPTKDGYSSIPFWNMINGPIGDALYHTGQLVTLRRSSGNPLDSNVNVFMGRNNE